MIELTAVRLEQLTSRLYVIDQDARVYVLQDRGEYFQRIGRARYQLHHCNMEGEVRSLVNKPWTLIKGEDAGSFPTGLSGTGEENLSQHGLDHLGKNRA